MYFLFFALLFLILWALLYPAMHLFRFGGRHLSQAVARWTRIDRYAAYLPIVIIVIAGGGITVWAADEFVDLAENLHQQHGKLQFADTHVHDAVVQHRSTSATTFFETMSTVGGPAGIAVIGAVAAIPLLITRRFRWAIYLVVNMGGGGLLDYELKVYFARARPDVAEMLRRASGYSFPSGHAMGSTVTFLALSYLAFRVTRDWKWQSAFVAFSITFIVSVALSRVYLGVHWISDVGAGITAGIFWWGSTTIAYEMLRRVRRVRARRRGTPSS